MRFEELPDGWHRDAKTGLEWSPDLGCHNHLNAVDVCANVGGRLPPVEEMLTLVDYTRRYPATQLPGMKSADYWTSTLVAAGPSYAWVMGFKLGHTGHDTKAGTYYVRAVRGKAKP